MLKHSSDYGQGSTLASRRLQIRAFHLLLVVVSAAFLWMLAPFANAIFWAVVLAILFFPAQKSLLNRMPQRATFCALLTLLMAILVVLLPLAFISQALVGEMLYVYRQMQGGHVEAGAFYESLVHNLPPS